MSKKIKSLLITFLLISFSFYYTNKLVNLSRKKDPIMIDIIEYTNEKHKSNNNEEVDIEQSYLKMKNVGKFDKSLLVFKEVKDSKNNYGSYIESGSINKNSVSIIVELSDTSYIEEFLSIINKKSIQVTFLVPKNIFDESIDIVKLIKGFGNDVELLSNNYTIYEVNKYNSILKLISTDKLSFCIIKEKNDNILKNCKSSKLYSIIPTIKTDTYLYSTVKNNLKNGSIILIKNNKNSLRELSSTINYINQKGKNIVLLNKLIEE